MMLKTFAALLFFTTLSLMAQPSWYYNLPKKASNTFIGYGQGSSEKEAKALALQDIAMQLSVKVKGSFSKKTTVHDGQAHNDLNAVNQQKSQADIKGYELRKLAFEHGTYFVAISYENILSFDKFVRKIQDHLPKKNEKQNAYLRHTVMAKKLRHALGKDIDFSLQRKDSLWYIAYKGQKVALDRRDFERFFKTVLNINIKLSTSKKDNTLFDGDIFHFKLDAKKSGYVSILTVYEDGTVATLVKNISVKKGKQFSIPDKDNESELKAVLIKAGVETIDEYVAILSAKPMLLDSFAAADEELITHERYKNFDTLIDFLDDKTYVTLKVVTKPR